MQCENASFVVALQHIVFVHTMRMNERERNVGNIWKKILLSSCSGRNDDTRLKMNLIRSRNKHWYISSIRTILYGFWISFENCIMNWIVLCRFVAYVLHSSFSCLLLLLFCVLLLRVAFKTLIRSFTFIRAFEVHF